MLTRSSQQLNAVPHQTIINNMYRIANIVLFVLAIFMVMGCSLPPLGGIGACYQHIIHLLNQPNDPLQVASLQGYLLPKKAHPMQYHLKQ